MTKGIRITAEDLETGEKGVRIIGVGDYCVICSNPMFLSNTARHSNGTVQLTLKLDPAQVDGALG